MKANTRLSAVCVAAAVGGVALLGVGPAARADAADLTFDAVTSAYGLEFRLTNPSIPTGIPIEGSGPTTQAELTSIPQSTAFASLPYPGDTGANITGVVSAVSGIPLPPYPFYVQSNNGAPAPKTGAFPGIQLDAESTDSRSASKATAFTDAAGYVAESAIDRAQDGSVSAVSTATQNGLQIGGTLTISGLVSEASAVLDSAGKLSTTSSLTVARFIAPALDITLPPEFCPPNQPCIPNPFQGQVLTSPKFSFSDGTFFVEIPGAGQQKYPVSNEAAAAAFSSIGIDMTVQEAIETDSGIVGSTLVLKSVLPSPPENQLYNGETPITYTIGRTAAAIVGSANAAVAPAGVAAGSPAAGATDPAPAGDVVAPAAVAPIDSAAAGLPGFAPPATGAGPGAVPTVDLAPGAAVGADEIVTTARFGQDGQLASMAPFYFVLVGVGLLGLLAGQFLRYLGVRSAWRS